ncbi:HAD-IA family hydrolase [Termitidicoccus mucosus]|uniref:Hydrolase n=1 Tax=Termitidicoccus mucosus TaxID=1184151 RepID=A0A178IP32_9BACT|nr:hydrolase [Opitutaceae bacterium TSB47]
MSPNERTVARQRLVAPSARREFDAAIFDMDGVITKTAIVHSLAWKQMFDEYLRRRETRDHEPFYEFTHARDYLGHVDGKPRYKGVESFLKSRGIDLPGGSPDDQPGTETVCGLGNRKNEKFNQMIETEGVSLYDSTIALIRGMIHDGIRVGLATSSRNSATILKRTGIAPLFATVVDGIVSEELGLKGKPAPDIFTTACANLGVPCARAIIVEDAVSGVQAGASGGFAFVVGVAREDNARELREHGAGVVVSDLAQIDLVEINRLARIKRIAKQI